ncbi:MAG: hypothetical protein RH978_15860 [Roseitalea porphyridii]|uniref:hypothetical protein n=1 Tax=Roseitalea porphyridii TaxID=1852022 RepID=UPI0032EE412F
MSAQQIAALVQAALASFKHEAPPEGSTRGSPWSEARVLSQLAKLKDSLVTPYPQRFVVKDNHEQMTKHPPDEADYWVVAETNDYLEFYDPRTHEFGLADRGTDDALPSTIGVRGDLIGVFCAR